MIIRIDTNTGLIEIEKDDNLKTAPIDHHPIHKEYNEIDIKRKYYKKTDKEYHRKNFGPIAKPRKVLNFLKSDKTVIQEPLLDFHY